MSSLGGAYDEGVGVDQDSSLALHWFLLAARAGDPPAMYMAGW